ATGMLVARGEFANRDEALWPGQLCDVRVRLRMDDNLTTVPREAVQVGQKGNYIFVANGDKAALRTVKIGREQGGRTIVLEGVKPGETIVVEGANLLRDGASIAVRQPQKPAAKPAAKPSAS
ncbi:MAG: efflux RND transporter periplasmic adaptor subunit, partial [Hyphomicrobiales bacterium]|nr:efflux RND transporter periplasmic adaptor subunit [Hyphomicrobiales bacterium]